MNTVRLFQRARAAGLASALCCAATLWSPAADADVVTDWNATTQAVLVAKGPAAPANVYYAMVHLAIYDAVNAIDQNYRVYAVTPATNPSGASKEAAAASAAYHLLVTLFPDQQAVLDPAYAASLASVPEGAGKTKGIVIGQEVAAGLIALRANDGRGTAVPYTFGSGPGVYQRTPPAFPNAAMPFMAKVTPFAMTRPSQFRAYGPPDLTSARYAQELNEVKALGAQNSLTRTPEQTEIGMFHTENPTTFWARNFRDLALARGTSVTQNARLFAMLWTGFGDAIIGCWDSKMYYNFWRPVTAIGAADTDENPDTDADAAWLPLAGTPPHPEYPAAHGCATGAFAEILQQFFGTKDIEFTFTSTVPGSVPHVFHCTDDLVDEIAVARIYGGMHYRTSAAHGLELGKKVGKLVTRNYFQRVRRH